MKVLVHPVAVVLLVAFIAGCGSEPSVSNSDVEQSKETNQKISDVVNSYKGLKLMTPEAVFVNPELAMLCVGASKEAVEHARVAKGPHANCSVKIYMNELAAKAFETNSSYPVGAIIVKEKSMLGYRSKTETEWQGTGDGVGGMVKREDGFDESNGNWEYFYFDDVKSIESGKMKSCIECHQKARDSDFIFGDWSKTEQDNGHGDNGYGDNGYGD